MVKILSPLNYWQYKRKAYWKSISRSLNSATSMAWSS